MCLCSVHALIASSVQADWEHSLQSIYNVLGSSKYGSLAPYIIHSVDFGNEPVGDCLGKMRDSFVSKLAAFRSK